MAKEKESDDDKRKSLAIPVTLVSVYTAEVKDGQEDMIIFTFAKPCGHNFDLALTTVDAKKISDGLHAHFVGEPDGRLLATCYQPSAN